MSCTLPMKNKQCYIRCSIIYCTSPVANMPPLSRVWRELWAPLASSAPAVILYVPHISSYLPSFMWLLAAFGSDGMILCLLSLHQGPQGDKGSRGETVRGAVLMNSFLSVLWAQNRILSMETAHHSASFALSTFHFLLCSAVCCYTHSDT